MTSEMSMLNKEKCSIKLLSKWRIVIKVVRTDTRWQSTVEMCKEISFVCDVTKGLGKQHRCL